MSNDKKFDLEDRTAIFSEKVVDFCRAVPKDLVTTPIISQLIRACTSIGANYCEADCAESKKDFIHKIGICKKESRESKYWLRIIARAVPDKSEEARILWKEASELNLIFIAIAEKTKDNIAKRS
ncbi:MAG: four helix bundle protein [Candidatus Moranbacteria bacterium]|nr:four helix bundle protein [Candidatus Moranbacteria bacterium]